ncbi:MULTISPECIES: NAD(P)H-hydrate dehydratase [unclassified Modestobacter]|uniref:NAD(P)H-hydrate dehydratase n=1 Tax=unclassified Modestobacter TaxID=2643866 RepID=UPI0022AAE848|nr:MULTISPECIES: NAD(P)H-hydrate dehydratase [unclassified Modestobacter]MCZ2823249.1 NAD(P)H-hydrate dehydratase [Modestobacter sp. VKM Ac-2981]MCZ2851494.1 NAD(P)H-hydrate dehydratase [Modestobacter sp. VKM Ac-2982]
MSRPRPDHTLVSPQVLRDWRLPEPTGGKEARGSILVVGGSTETVGAVLLAAEAALRSGAGKLQVVVPSKVAPHVSISLPEALVRGVPSTEAGAIRGSSAELLLDLAQQASAVLIGPGMADEPETRRLVEELLPELQGPVALDALGLAAVTADPACLHHLGGNVVLTPNPTELAIALHAGQQELDDDLAGAAQRLAEQAHAVVALGGATSWIAVPDGRLWADESGGAGLGVSGSGDVRAGIVAGLLARGAEPAQAAVWAAHVHGRAGERLAATVGRLGFLARELPPEIPRVMAEVDL